MRLLMFRDDDGDRPGVLLDDQVVDLRALGAGAPQTLLEVIEGSAELLDRVRAVIEDNSNTVHTIPLNTVQVLAPLTPRGNVIAIGRNYHEHATESARARGMETDRPTVFTKAQTSVSGPYDDIPLDATLTEQLDWEVELAVVTGRTGISIPRERAMEYVFGYTVLNDISARDVQFGWGGQYFKGKSFDGSCPIGPWIVTADEVPDPQDLTLSLRVNGELKQQASTRDMIFSVAEIMAQLSLGMTLPAGSLIATGTPAGVGFARTPPEFLQPGDVIEATVEGIGTLRNIVRAVHFGA